MLIDTHTHVNFKDFQDPAGDSSDGGFPAPPGAALVAPTATAAQAVIARALNAGVWMINAGTQIDTSRAAVELARKYEQGVYAAVALHPEHTYRHRLTEEGHTFMTREEVFDSAAYRELARDPKVVAIGECGLDYYYFGPEDDTAAIKQKQRAAFDRQIQLAAELDRALMIHCRPTKGGMDAYEDIWQIMRDVTSKNSKFRFEVHCYTGNLELAQEFVEIGGYISCSGIITFDKTGRSEEVVKGVPLERLLIETDAPFSAPAPYRGKRNEPAYVEHVARKIAEFKGVSYEEAAAATTRNARELFGI